MLARTILLETCMRSLETQSSFLMGARKLYMLSDQLAHKDYRQLGGTACRMKGDELKCNSCKTLKNKELFPERAQTQYMRSGNLANKDYRCLDCTACQVKGDELKCSLCEKFKDLSLIHI